MSYYIFDHGTASVAVLQYPIASLLINRAMPVLIQLLNANTELACGIQAATFLSTTHGDLSITLIYDKDISRPAWEPAARELLSAMRSGELSAAAPEGEVLQELTLIGRSKGLNKHLLVPLTPS